MKIKFRICLGKYRAITDWSECIKLDQGKGTNTFDTKLKDLSPGPSKVLVKVKHVSKCIKMFGVSGKKDL